MFAGIIKRVLAHEARKRWSLLTTAFAVTASPTAFVHENVTPNPAALRAATRFILLAVATVLLIETAFSLVFQTAFSDLIHHAFPILVALTGGFAIYVVLKLLWTKAATLSGVLTGSFYVGGTALLVMLALIFLWLGIDFTINYNSVLNSGCKPRTIMCLVSGNTQTDYGLLQDAGSTETQGESFKYVIWTIIACIAIYTSVLATVFKAQMGIARWRTIVAAVVAVFILSPIYMVLLNMIYRWFYALG